MIHGTQNREASFGNIEKCAVAATAHSLAEFNDQKQAIPSERFAIAFGAALRAIASSGA